MISMRNLSQVIKKELLYQLYSKKVAILLLILVSLCVVHLVGLFNGVVSSYNMYQRTENMYIEQGIDIIESLQAENNIVVDGNTTFTDNPLKEDFVNLAISIQNLKSNNVIANTLEYITFVFCTLIFGIYASHIATYDFKYKTHKSMSVHYEQNEIVIGKLLSIIIVMVSTLAIALLFTFFASFAVNIMIKNTVPVENFTIDIFNYQHTLLSQCSFVFAVLSFYIVVGFSMAYILKSMVIPSITLLLYTLLLPILGAYDFRNVISHFSHSLFSFTARFNMFKPEPIDNLLGILILVGSASILFGLLLIIANKRSSYD
ncbi:MAG: hypothetical protein ACK5I7_06330 [Anaerotignum sp.]